MSIKFMDAIKIGAGAYIGWKLPGLIASLYVDIYDIYRVLSSEDKESLEYKRSANNLKHNSVYIYDSLVKGGYIVEQKTRRKIGF